MSKVPTKKVLKVPTKKVPKHRKRKSETCPPYKDILIISDEQLEGAIAVFTREHSLTLYNNLLCATECEFGGLDSEYPWRVFLLHLKTHLGNQEDFWRPLFKHIAGRDPAAVYSKKDDMIWDRIIPPGYKVLKIIQESIIFSHEGPFMHPLPMMHRGTQK